MSHPCTTAKTDQLIVFAHLRGYCKRRGQENGEEREERRRRGEEK
jgi:hypothetical protein